MHIPYPKIHRLGKEEVEGILDGWCFIEEKIDRANTSIWIEDGKVKCGSRRRELTGGFRGFYDFVTQHTPIKKYLEKNPTHRLYGEWLVKHTIQYKEDAYNKFYLFDIFDIQDEEVKVLDRAETQKVGKELGLDMPIIFDYIQNPTEEVITAYENPPKTK